VPKQKKWVVTIIVSVLLFLVCFSETCSIRSFPKFNHQSVFGIRAFHVPRFYKLIFSHGYSQNHHMSPLRIFNIYHDASYKTRSTLIIIHFSGHMVLQKVIQIRGKAIAEPKRTDQDREAMLFCFEIRTPTSKAWVILFSLFLTPPSSLLSFGYRIVLINLMFAQLKNPFTVVRIVSNSCCTPATAIKTPLFRFFNLLSKHHVPSARLMYGIKQLQRSIMSLICALTVSKYTGEPNTITSEDSRA